MVVSIKLLCADILISQSPDLPEIPATAVIWIQEQILWWNIHISRYDEDNTDITGICQYGDTRSILEASQQCIHIRHTKPFSILHSNAISGERALCWAFLIFLYSHSLTGMAPIELDASVLIYYLPLCVLSLSIPVIFLIFAVLKRNKSNNIGAATHERM